MMLSCPKCGFTQPKDRYCANCGIDMQAYRPAEKPFVQKLVGNWMFQVAIVAVFVAGAYALMKGRNSSIDDRVANIDEAPQVRVIQEMTKPVRDPEPAAATAAPTAAAGAPADTSVSAFQVQPTGTGEATAGSSSASGAAPDPVPPTDGSAPPAKSLMRAAETTLGEPGAAGRTEAANLVQRVRIHFAEAQRPYVGELVNSTRNLASYGSFSGGVILDLAARLKNEAQSRNLTPLDGAVDYPVRLNQPIIVFKGTRDEASDQNIGLTAQLTPTVIDENGVQLQVEILRVLREPGSTQTVEQSFQETFIIPKEGGAFMAGLLPRRTVGEDEGRVYANSNVLRVMTSPAFQANATDFLLLIEAK